MPRPLRAGVDEKILDAAAALFARHGFEQTSLKSLADAVGLSKAGLLHHFPSKDALFEAAWEQSRVICRHVLDLVGDMPAGTARERRSIELLTDYALDRPGMVSLLFRSMTAPGEDPQQAQDELLLNEMFVIKPQEELPRAIRIVGALSAMAVLTLLANQENGDKTTWRPLILATCYDALGHREA
ncbi:helix-turn-helix domain-containing protein [Lentzea sp.]|uniref:TetR/AcrR family transcriptional regulator n=1 Tax=Lentzea sp. TaxID=56099 RepID=UPI002B6FBE36|nr:helix-turn-helix domain-containing protein [Lentzea sp.]HUQ55121.1 helix-turn-helix domain-containing protein [Lentzea sp.]